MFSLTDSNEINYYVELSIKQNLSINALKRKIKNNEYERLPDKTKEKLIEKQDNSIEDFIKHPIIIKSNLTYENISEKVLKQLILEDMENFLKELGVGFSFIASEYKIRMGKTSNYIDLLLYNIKYNCYTVVELKVTELRKEHLGQIQVYMNYIDENIKDATQNKTMGIIIVKEDNQFIMKYCSDDRIFRTTFTLN